MIDSIDVIPTKIFQAVFVVTSDLGYFFQGTCNSSFFRWSILGSLFLWLYSMEFTYKEVNNSQIFEKECSRKCFIPVWRR
jgi:hypothetical protein